jgi:indolepyruvate ferredoxin oxidoreductase
MERNLIGEFEAHADELLENLTATNINVACDIVNEYLEIRGYGPVKEQAASEARSRIADKIAAFRQVREKAA